VRIEQVLMMTPPLLLCYQLGQLASFYHGLLLGILGPGAALSQTVASCRDVANRYVQQGIVLWSPVCWQS
jgi:hypothetical protein